MKKILAVLLILTFIATAGCAAEETDSIESAEQETITVEVPSGVAVASEEEASAFFPEIEGYWFCRNIEETALNTYTESYVVAFYIDENGDYIGELSVYGLKYSEKGIIEFTAISKDNTYAEIIQYTEEDIVGGSENSENQSWFIIDTGEQGDDVIDISVVYSSSDGVDQIIEFENCVHYDSMDEIDAELY
jgi:hypothetical protein